jgi:hypothetical protein
LDQQGCEIFVEEPLHDDLTLTSSFLGKQLDEDSSSLNPCLFLVA